MACVPPPQPDGQSCGEQRECITNNCYTSGPPDYVYVCRPYVRTQDSTARPASPSHFVPLLTASVIESFSSRATRRGAATYQTSDSALPTRTASQTIATHHLPPGGHLNAALQVSVILRRHRRGHLRRKALSLRIPSPSVSPPRVT